MKNKKFRNIPFVCFCLISSLILTIQSNAQGLTLTRAESSPVQLKLNKRFYSSGDPIGASLRFKTAVPMPHAYVIFVSTKTGDAEGLKLRNTGPLEYSTEGELKILIGLNKAKNDGVLTVGAGEVITAYYYNSSLKESNPQMKNKPQQPDIVSEFAFIRGTENYMSQFLLGKQYALQPNEAAINAATVTVEGKIPVQIARNQLIFYSNNDQDWKSFMEYSQCKLLSTSEASFPASGIKQTTLKAVDKQGQQPVKATAYLVEVPVKDLNLNDYGQYRQFLGYKQKIACSDPEALKLIMFSAMANLSGYAVALNPRLQYHGTEPITTLNQVINPGAGDNMPVSFTQPFTDIRKVWNYMAIWDRDNTTVNVAVIDIGFNPSADFRNRSTMRQCEATLSNVICAPRAAEGIPTVGNSLFGERSWHGTGVVSRLGAVLNNGFGTAGTGGQVVQPMLIKLSGVESYAFNIGGAIRSAVTNGAHVINISGGYPCAALTSLGDFNYCDPGTRTAICATLFAIVQSGAVLACSALAWIPFAAETCIALTSSAFIAACYAQFLVGDPAAVMRSAIQFAKANGVPIVTSAGNIISRASLSGVPPELGALINLDLNRMTVEDWAPIPASLDDVICVGASNPSASESDMTTILHFPPFIPFGNNQIFGNRVDVWAPEDGVYFAPADATRPEGPTNAITIDRTFGGTSASAPFIAGLVANAMAINPTLNRNTSSDRASIPARIRSLLSTTAWRNGTSGLANDPRRRNLVNPIGFLKAVGMEPGSPIPAISEPAYGNNWNIGDNEDADDTNPTTILYRREGAEVKGSIVHIPGVDGAPAITDVDRYRVNVLSSYRPEAAEMITIKLRMPVGSRFGDLEVRGEGIVFARTTMIGANEEEKEYTGPIIRSGGMALDFVVEGETPNQDNIYNLRIGNAPAPAVPVTLNPTPRAITDLCPTNLTTGDREFAGGPLFNISARLELAEDGRKLVAVINFRAEETKGDRTTVTGSFTREVLDMGSGLKIVSFGPATGTGELVSNVRDFRGGNAGSEFGADNFGCNEGVVDTPPVTGNLIRSIQVVGDSGANDVAAPGGDCRCDAKIKRILFNRISITVVRR